MKKSEGKKIEKELKLLNAQIKAGSLTPAEMKKAIIKMKSQIIALKKAYLQIVDKEN